MVKPLKQIKPKQHANNLELNINVAISSTEYCEPCYSTGTATGSLKGGREGGDREENMPGFIKKCHKFNMHNTSIASLKRWLITIQISLLGAWPIIRCAFGWGAYKHKPQQEVNVNLFTRSKAHNYFCLNVIQKYLFLRVWPTVYVVVWVHFEIQLYSRFYFLPLPQICIPLQSTVSGWLPARL